MLIHRYFWPDTPPYAIILKKIAARLAHDGHNVEVLSTQPAYKPEAGIPKQKTTEKINGFKVRRLALLPESSGKGFTKAVNMFLFSLRIIFFALRNHDYDVIMISTSPPILAGLTARIFSKLSNAKLLYHCMDIHPEIGKISGEFSNKYLFRFLQNIDSRTCRFADRVIVLSGDMKNAIVERGNNASAKIDVIQNFNLDDNSNQVANLDKKYRKKEGVFRMVFAGNIGRFQGLDLFVETFMEFKETDNIELVFLGDGKMTKPLKEKASNAGVKNIKFIPHQPIAVANTIIQTADLGIVSLSPGIYRYAYPTKIIAYLSTGCPLLVMIEENSSLASFVDKYHIGVHINQNNKTELTQTISDLNSNRERLNKMKINARKTFDEFYNESLVLDKWSDLINNL